MRWYWSTAGIFVAATSLPLIALSWFAWRRRALSAAGILAVVVAAAGWWSLAHALELTAPTPAQVSLWGDLKYLGAVVAPPAWVLFAARYTGRGRLLNPAVLAALALVPAATLLLLLNGATHDLLQAVPDQVAPEQLAVTETGPLGYALAGYHAVLIVAGTALLVQSYVRIGRVYRRQSILLAAAAVLPAGGALVHLTALTGSVDPTPFLFLATSKVLVWGVFRFGLLELAPVARDAIIERMSDGVIVLDTDRRIVDMNPAAERQLRNEAPLVIGQPVTALIPRSNELLDRSAGEAPDVHEEIRLGVLGAARDYDLVLSALDDQHGQPNGHLLVLRDITERKLAEERLQRLAHYDPLTGLPNRKLLADRLDSVIQRARRHEWPLALLFCDLDRFKRVNDTLGHDVGDLVLQQVAARFMEVLRPGDTLARLGGDEFVIILPDAERAEDAGIVARKLVECLGAPITAGPHELYLTVSVGVCLYPQDGHDPSTLLRSADDAMYRAKARGRNRFEFHRAQPDPPPFDRLDIERELRGARRRGELEVWYQPTIALASGQVSGMEALLRWRHPTRGVIAPDTFIPVAEESELIHALGSYALRESCRQAVRWDGEGQYPPPWMAVNLSARQFERADLATEVADVLADTGLAPERLALEVTESVVMNDAQSAVKILHDLKRLGVGIATDDFGTGFTSLGQLKHYPLDVLKIDRSFVSGLGRQQEDEVIVSAMIHLAHDLGLEVVAEGVEYPAQHELLRSLDCDHAQGYLFSRPLPRQAADRYLETAWGVPARG